ncbi:MAG: hypothetical protein ABEN55_12125, partial [Bradymonadaceae bacterium]
MFDRTVKVIAGPKGGDGVEIEGVRIDFDVKHSLNGDPNKAKLKLYNLTDDTTDIFRKDDVEVRVIAGYDNPGLIFVGGPIKDGVNDKWDGTERILEVEAQDGGREIAR